MSTFKFKLNFLRNTLRSVMKVISGLMLPIPHSCVCKKADLYLSSSLVKEVAQNNGDLSHFVTKEVEEKIIEKVELMSE